MVKIINGNALDFTENMLLHQTNCLGVMGGGIARQIKERWHDVYIEYRQFCEKDNFNESLLGKTLPVKIGDNKFVVNLFAQYKYGTHQRQTSYTHLYSCLKETFTIAKLYNYSVAIPYGMSCTLAGGNWDYVFPLICMLAEEYNINVTIYKLGYITFRSNEKVGNAIKFILNSLSDEKILHVLQNGYGINISNNMDNSLKIQTLFNWWQEYNSEEFNNLRQYMVYLIAGHRYASYLILLMEGKISIS